jgi:hypothetical protein
MDPSTAEELLSIKDEKKQCELGNMIVANDLSSRDVCEIIKNMKRNPVYDYSSNEILEIKMRDIDEKSQRSFDKCIIALIVAMNKLGRTIEQYQDKGLYMKY